MFEISFGDLDAPGMCFGRKLNYNCCPCRICWISGMPVTNQTPRCHPFPHFLITYFGNLRIDDGQVFKRLLPFFEIRFSLGFCLANEAEWWMVGGLILSLACSLHWASFWQASSLWWMNHNRPLGSGGLCLTPMTFGFIQNKICCLQSLESRDLLYSLVFLPSAVSALPPGCHEREFTLALSSCRGLRGTIPVCRMERVFSSLQTVTQISFYDLLSQRQLGGCIGEALLTGHT